MDPITAINLEFARLVEQDWSPPAADGLNEPAMAAPRVSAIGRLRALGGASLTTLGIWLLKLPPRPLRAEHES